MDAALYDATPARLPRQMGRPRLKGARRETLKAVLKDSKTEWTSIEISNWYGGGRREVVGPDAAQVVLRGEHEHEATGLIDREGAAEHAPVDVTVDGRARVVVGDRGPAQFAAFQNDLFGHVRIPRRRDVENAVRVGRALAAVRNAVVVRVGVAEIRHPVPVAVDRRRAEVGVARLERVGQAVVVAVRIEIVRAAIAIGVVACEEPVVAFVVVPDTPDYRKQPPFLFSCMGFKWVRFASTFVLVSVTIWH